MTRRAGPPAPTTVTSSTDRLFALAMGYIGVATFVLVFFFSVAAVDFAPGEPLLDQAINAPLWVWILATTIAAGAAVIVDLVRQAATRSMRSGR